jgi:hypothetical protein
MIFSQGSQGFTLAERSATALPGFLVLWFFGFLVRRVGLWGLD